MKYFIITVDTEGDNLWAYKNGDRISTENTKYIPRFQELCEKYDFKPVYLTNYEMLCDDDYVQYIKDKEAANLCEVGFHLHAWNNPPLYELKAEHNGNPYLIEYPDDIMKAKFDCLYNIFCKKIGHKPISHRAGRWAMDDRYFNLLEEYNLKVDCSVTPGIDWSNNMGETRGGVNYKDAPKGTHYIGRILEVPPTIRTTHLPIYGSIKHRIKTVLLGEKLELRPATCSLKQMKFLAEQIRKGKGCNYIEFMLHSSELMPGGSPYFPNQKSINTLYRDMDSLFRHIQTLGYKGITLADYYHTTNLVK